ncbi:MAG: ferritin-like domain-containing protein [Thermomicrobiales bacterium]
MEQTAQQPGTNSRRSFLGKGLALGAGTIGAALLNNSLALGGVSADSGDGITRGDIAILKFLAAAELIEADLWNQYAVMAANNPDYTAALTTVDDSSPRYAHDTTDDETSHQMLINAFLRANGQQPVNFDRFRTLHSPAVPGATSTPNLTNLTNLTVDTSWWARYRSDQNPDFGATFPQLVTIKNRPTIPTATGITGDAMQAIADAALFHFVTIEQGGTSLYPTLALKVTNVDVLRILVSIGPVETFHFATFEGSLESLPPLSVPATATSPAMVFPDLKGNHSETPDNLDAAGVMPDPCTFLRRDFPACSVVRPTSTENGGAVAAAKGFIDSGLFMGQPKAFTDLLLDLATAADRAQRNGSEGDQQGQH